MDPWSTGNADGYVRALAIFESWLARKNRGEAESETELLAAHEDLRECLSDMLDAGVSATDLTPEKTAPGLKMQLPRPDQIGPYKILDVLGEGGMGTVYLAERREPFLKKVALKVIKAGMDTAQVLQRFEMERQALALMEHDNIAKVLDAGSTETGQPYFVMELVKGMPLTEYCNSQRLSIRERLELFQQVCAGVQHAHQKGIIHRDLKPKNILATVQGGTPVPKIIDFGLARATGIGLAGATDHTGLGLIHGTPPYMSPEQCGIGALDLDTRTDIYSLGVVLYELLTDKLPFSPDELQRAGLEAMVALIHDTDPRQPSTRLSSFDQEGPSLATQRRTDLRTLVRSVRGDLDWITMKALEKDRTRRYDTAAALADDVGRHLRDQPVHAGPPSMTYVLGRFLRRNRGKVVAAGLLLSTVVVGAVVSIAFAWKAERALADYQKLVIGAEVDALEYRAASAHPAWPKRIVGLRELAGIAERLVAQIPELERAMEELRAGHVLADGAERAPDRGPHPEAARVDADAQLVEWLNGQIEGDRRLQADAKAIGRAKVHELETDLAAARQRIAFSARVAIEGDRRRRFLYDRLELQCKRLRDLKRWLLPDLRRRRDQAVRVRAETITRYAAEWSDAVAAIAASERYKGFAGLEPQLGLVPLGQDPKSGLQEFAHPVSGAIPKRDSEEHLVIGAEHGIVFVLLPPGKVHLGVDDTHSDAFRQKRSVLDIAPFFLAKHEMTRAQWQRLGSGLPGLRFYEDGARDLRNIAANQLGKPVNMMSWHMCHDLLRRYGLTFPGDQEWEYACKAGTTTTWYTGDTAASLLGAENILDRDFVRTGQRHLAGYHVAPFADGFAGLANAFARLRPNSFGLHQMHGNVAEWCFDLRQRGTRVKVRAFRGGSFNQGTHEARSVAENWVAPRSAARNLGLRPARRLRQDL